MTNAEKFIQIMNRTFNAGFTMDNLSKTCSPCGTLKKREYSCDNFTCDDCEKWWLDEYIEKPLTLEEIKQLDGEPVYCVLGDKENPAYSGWGIVTLLYNECDYLEKVLVCNGEINLTCLHYENDSKFNIYRNKPEVRNETC